MAKRRSRTFLAKQARRATKKREKISDEDTVYYWWWEFLRRNTDYIRCCERNGRGPLSCLYADFGDVRGTLYREWLYAQMPGGETRKEYLFAEAPTPLDREAVVTLNSIAEWDTAYEESGYLLVAVNMRETSRESLRKKFDLWLRNEPRAPNTLTPEERSALLKRRLYEYVTVNGKKKRVRKDRGLSEEFKIQPLPRKEKMTGKRGRRPLAVYQHISLNGMLVRQRIASVSTARYPLWQHYSVSNLRDMIAVVDAVDAAKTRDETHRQIKTALVPLRKRLAALDHYKEHKLIAGNRSDARRVGEEEQQIYDAVRRITAEELTVGEIRGRLERAWVNRRNKETTTYSMIGETLIKPLEWRAGHSEGRNRWLTKKMNELYTRGKAVIANTAQGKFPKDS